ncbi:MAG TPA: ATP-binding protein, partial [Candidatus Binatia bacterium]
ALQHAKDELAQANVELEERVHERTLELEHAHSALLREMEEGKKLEAQLRQAQKLESIGTLAGGIAHDFNNILNIIKGYAAQLRARTSGHSELQESVEVIDKATERGASIVQQMLAIARRNELKFESVQLNPSLERLEHLLKGLFPKTIEITLHLDPAAPVVRADPNQIDQVLLNICVNARDALADGGRLVLTTSVVPGSSLRERFQNVKAQQYACISVTDTGAGMNDETKSRIFEPFFTTKEQGQGTGLGLSVAYGIVTNHGGLIDVVSGPGRGTTFLIYLPLLNTGTESHERAGTARERDNIPSSGQGYTVLFVEDEAQQLKLMQRLLESEGYRVLPAADGIEAVQTFMKHRDEIAVVVLDLGLPKLNGWQVFQEMQKGKPNLKPIVATGYVSPEIRSALADGKLSAVITKPYRLEEVLKEIAETARKSRNTAAVASSEETAERVAG